MSIYGDILSATKRKLESLALSGVRDQQIRISTKSQFSTGTPQSGIHLVKDSERHGAGTMNEDEIGYPVVLFLSVGGGGATNENDEKLQEWRESIYNDFNLRREPLTSFLDRADVQPLRCNVTFGDGYLTSFWKDRWDVNHLVVWCWVRRTRT